MSYLMMVTILGIISVMFTTLIMYVFFYHSKAYREYQFKSEKKKYLMEASADDIT